MNVDRLQPFPSHFVLQDLTAITAPVFELKKNPHQEEAYRAIRKWFTDLGVYEKPKEKKFMSHSFDLYAGLSFPDADVTHLQTCIAFFLWAFSFDDLSDEGEFQSKPERVQVGVDISMEVLNHPERPPPQFKYAAMLHDIWRWFRSTASPGACNRFKRAVESWMKSQVEQAASRADNLLPSVEEFIVLRRRTIGGEIVEAMVEYSLDLQIPEYVWEHPILDGLSKAAIDIMTWPNKEQSDNDFSNLVFCVMLEQDVGLQRAIDIVTAMLARRVQDYADLKKQLPSFGPEVDSELAKYFKALEHYVQGTVVWYYESPRYFRGMDVSNKKDMVIPVYERTVQSIEPSGAPASKESPSPFSSTPVVLIHDGPRILLLAVAFCVVWQLGFLALPSLRVLSTSI
ncbi:terpenoid synthase [Panus rudis PR-1116 ss-1]|nr:terpenoid synthase [Panus rudis PR-1116 ss-1]